MRVTIVVPTLAHERTRQHVLAQTRAFRQRGDEVYLAMPSALDHPYGELGELGVTVRESVPHSDLYLYHHADLHPLLAALRQQDQGSVIVHDHGSAPQEWLPAHYSDLCLVDEEARRDELIDAHGLAPARVQVLPAPDDQREYENAMNQWVHCVYADDWPQLSEIGDRPATRRAMPEPNTETAALRGALQLGHNQADVMLRDYTVRSRIPVVGRLVAWLRRNLTSHLREPYLDPTLERQVAFNRTVLDWMEQVQTRLEALENTVQDLQVQPSAAPQKRMSAAPSDRPIDNAQESNAG